MSNRKTTLFYAVLVAVASMAIGMVIASRMDLSPASSAQTMAAPAMNSAPITGQIDADTFRTIAKAASPFVVNIRTEQRQRTQELSEFFGGDEFFRRFFGEQEPPQRRAPRDNIMESAGTGFIIDGAGLILTNNHVVEGATRIQVGLFGSDEGEYYDAQVLGRDPLTDSALIELTQKPTRQLAVAKFGDSDQIQPGDWVMAIGNPFLLGHTVTVGILSAKGRPLGGVAGREQPMLQTDAAINPGNSGGPLLNIRGEVIGINTSIFTGRGQAGNLGIGFAVPINLVRELLPQLRSGKVTRGRIGVSLPKQVQKDVLEQLGAKDGHGALVQSVEPGGPAQKAGLEPGDVIVEFNGKPVLSNDELVNQVVRTKPGTSVPIKVLRSREAKSMTVTVAELDLDAEGSRQSEEETEGNTATGFGMTLQDLTPEIARQLRVPSGTTGAVIVEVDPRSPAGRILQRGDVLLEVNRKAVSSAAEASRELQKVRSGQIATLLVLRSGQEVFLTIRKE